MKKISFLIFVFLTISMLSCRDKSSCCTIVDTVVNIHYQTQSGENLINSDENFDESKIKIYYKNGDEFEYIYKSNLDSPNMHNLNEDENGHLILTIYPSNYYYDTNQSTTSIELNPEIVDTLVCEFELSSNSTICKKAWLNGIEMNKDRFLKIKK